jgi:hypothetical protein
MRVSVCAHVRAGAMFLRRNIGPVRAATSAPREGRPSRPGMRRKARPPRQGRRGARSTQGSAQFVAAAQEELRQDIGSLFRARGHQRRPLQALHPRVPRHDAATASVLYSLPRFLGIAFAVFISLFALEMSSEDRGLAETALALLVDLAATPLCRCCSRGRVAVTRAITALEAGDAQRGSCVRLTWVLLIGYFEPQAWGGHHRPTRRDHDEVIRSPSRR